MSKLTNRALSLILAIAIVMAIVLIPGPIQVNAATETTLSDSTASLSVQDGVTLHCWNWSFKNIEANMATIAEKGYTAIQTSPIQPLKESTVDQYGLFANKWWVYYQPVDFCIDTANTNALGTKADFESMCKTAHEYGIKVIVDVVANHMADYNGSGKHPSIADYLENDDECWHTLGTKITNYYDRYNITQYCLDGVPDLNTGSKKVQGYVLDYLKECVDAGADGFRFDAVKHIETPDDNASFASDFWPTVINGIKQYAPDVYCYGEVLYHADENQSLPDSAYTKYFPVTDNSWSNMVRNTVVNGNNAGAFSPNYHKNTTADKLVLWAGERKGYSGRSGSGL